MPHVWGMSCSPSQIIKCFLKTSILIRILFRGTTEILIWYQARQFSLVWAQKLIFNKINFELESFKFLLCWENDSWKTKLRHQLNLLPGVLITFLSGSDCFTHVLELSTQHANVLKCMVWFMVRQMKLSAPIWNTRQIEIFHSQAQRERDLTEELRRDMGNRTLGMGEGGG